MENETTESESMDTSVDTVETATADEADISIPTHDTQDTIDNSDGVEIDTTDMADQADEITEINFEDMSDAELEEIINHLDTPDNEADREEKAAEFKLPEKFSNTEDLLKSYQALEGKIGSFKGAPDEYKIEGLDMSNPTLSGLADTARDLNMSNEAFSTFVNKYDSIQEQMQEVSVQEEMGKLGPNAQNRIDNINNFLTTNMSEHQANTLQAMATSADNIAVIENLISQARPSSPATGVQSNSSAPTDSEIQQMMFAKDQYGNLKMEVDSAYASKVNGFANQMWN